MAFAASTLPDIDTPTRDLPLRVVCPMVKSAPRAHAPFLVDIHGPTHELLSWRSGRKWPSSCRYLPHRGTFEIDGLMLGIMSALDHGPEMRKKPRKLKMPLIRHDLQANPVSPAFWILCKLMSVDRPDHNFPWEEYLSIMAADRTPRPGLPHQQIGRGFCFGQPALVGTFIWFSDQLTASLIEEERIQIWLASNAGLNYNLTMSASWWTELVVTREHYRRADKFTLHSVLVMAVEVLEQSRSCIQLMNEIRQLFKMRNLLSQDRDSLPT